MLSLLIISLSHLLAQCETISFEKDVGSDWTLPENQDSLSPTVIITRKNSQSLYNIAQEEGYDGSGARPIITLFLGNIIKTLAILTRNDNSRG